ncbi:hypothetical protein Tco_1017413 [Tanacetum coccineum]|uniref:Reverse transcriptase domain-containing protein n=1 Tax=Tanacetum coccineum TaxID=301880 RepID=A0ABQ5FST9_9ASTR
MNDLRRTVKGLTTCASVCTDSSKFQSLWKIKKRQHSTVVRDFAYRRMSFGLCNAPATFQRCMMPIFHGMVEDFMEVFMDDFSIEISVPCETMSVLLSIGISPRSPSLANVAISVSVIEWIWELDTLIHQIVPPNWTPEKRRRFFSQVKNYFWDEPYAFKLYASDKCDENDVVAGNESL